MHYVARDGLTYNVPADVESAGREAILAWIADLEASIAAPAPEDDPE